MNKHFLERLNLNDKIKKLEETVQEKDRIISAKNEYNLKQQQTLNNLNMRIESLQDPTGLMEFRRLLHAFGNDIEVIKAEKEQQYRTMNQVCKIMEVMEEKKVD